MGLRLSFRRAGGVAILAALLASCAQSPSPLNPKSDETNRIAVLSWGLFGVALVIFGVVTLLLIIAYLRSRRSDSDEVLQTSDDRRPMTFVLLAGAVLPTVILFGFMIWSISIDTTASAQGNHLMIEVIGHQLTLEADEAGIYRAQCAA